MRLIAEIDTPTKADLAARDELIAKLQAEVQSLRAQLRRQTSARLEDLQRFLGPSAVLRD